MISILTPFFSPLGIDFYSYKKTKKGTEFKIVFSGGFVIWGDNGRLSFYSEGGYFELVDRQLYSWLIEILHSPSDKFLPHLIAGAIKLFAINNGLIDYDFGDSNVRDVIDYLGV
jgi:hypothetical protein